MVAVIACLAIGAFIGTLAIITDVTTKKAKKKATKVVKMAFKKRKQTKKKTA